MSDNSVQHNSVQHNKVTNRRADQMLLRLVSVARLLNRVQTDRTHSAQTNVNRPNRSDGQSDDAEATNRDHH